MRARSAEEALPYESLAEQELNILLSPFPCRQCLQKHENFLEVHLHELLRPLDEESGADIKMELGEPLFFRLCQ